jgi:hypothetical protein
MLRLTISIVSDKKLVIQTTRDILSDTKLKILKIILYGRSKSLNNNTLNFSEKNRGCHIFFFKVF